MKRIILIGFICLFCGILQMMGQTDSYMVKGKLSGMSEDIKIIVLDRQGGNSKFDTLKVENGEFVYSGKADQRQQLTFMRLSQKEQEASRAKWKGKRGMILSGKFDLTFFVSPGAQIEIQGDQKDFPFVEVVSEDEFNQGMMELQHLNLKELKEINVLHDALNDAVLADDSVAKMDVFEQQNALRERISQRTTEWITSHPNREYAMWLYLNSGLTSKTAGELKQQYDRFSNEVQQSEAGKKLAELIRVRTALAPGAPAPDFTLKNIYTGEDIHLADYRGKYVLLDFWASWCLPCREEMPGLLAAARDYERTLAVYAVSIDENLNRWKQAVEADGSGTALTHVILRKDDPDYDRLFRMFGIETIPHNFLLDADGKIVAVDLRGDALRSKLEELQRE